MVIVATVQESHQFSSKTALSDRFTRHETPIDVPASERPISANNCAEVVGKVVLDTKIFGKVSDAAKYMGVSQSTIRRQMARNDDNYAQSSNVGGF